MIVHLLDLPDDDAALVRWLDERIVSPDLHELIAELAALHALPTRPTDCDAEEAARWLGPALPAVLSEGTAALGPGRRGDLLRDPRLLAGLQELAFVDGGRYWHELALRVNPPPTPLPVERLGGGSTAIAPAARSAEGGHGRFARIAAALAASVLVAVGAWMWSRPAAPWGWNRPEALAARESPAAYLEALAAAAGEWSSEKPTTERALDRRLRDLLAGCDRLIAAPHAALAEADRRWLVERCEKWRESIAGHLDLLGRAHDVAKVRDDADATVGKLVDALRKQAAEIRERAPA